MKFDIETLKSIIKNESNISFGYLFGSYYNNTYTKNSDIDIALFFDNYSLNYHLELNLKLGKRLKKDIDIVILNSIKNIYLLEDILTNSIVIKDNEKRFDFEVYKEHEIIDFKQTQKMIYDVA